MAGQRPDLWIGHTGMKSNDVDASEAFMIALGLRKVFRTDTFAILELRGGTHLIISHDDAGGAPDAGFDFMVEDVDAAHARIRSAGLSPTDISRGKIHDSFEVTDPGGTTITINSTHVEDHDAV